MRNKWSLLVHVPSFTELIISVNRADPQHYRLRVKRADSEFKQNWFQVPPSFTGYYYVNLGKYKPSSGLCKTDLIIVSTSLK